MTARLTALPASVQALNALLAERRAGDPRLRRALVTSYVAHAGAIALVILVTGRRSDLSFTAKPTGPPGIIHVTPLLGTAAPPGPRPRRQPQVPRAEPAPRERAPAPVADPVEIAKDEDGIREHKAARPRRSPDPPAKTTREAMPRPAKTAPIAGRRATGSGAGDLLGGGKIPGATGGGGSPLGTLSGSPDGGLSALLFTNQWYVTRVQDIVYENWGNPFPGRRPEGTFEVVIEFEIRRDGTVLSPSVAQSSHHAAWDRAGLRAVENAKLPPLPADYPGASVRVAYAFTYDERNQP